MREEDLSYFDSKDFRRALRAYKKAQAEKRPVYMDADDLTDIAEYFIMTGRAEESAKAICTALRLHPDSTDPRVFLARQNMFSDNMDEAKAICDAIPDQEDREVTFLRGELILREQGEDQADKYLLREATKVTDERELYYNDCAEIFIDYAKWKTAALWIKRIHKEFVPNAKTDYLQAEVLLGMGKHRQALPLLTGLLDENPFNTDLWVMQGEAYLGLGNFKKALDCSENALAIDSNCEKALAIKGNCLFQNGNFDEAIPIYENLVKTSPDSDIYHYIHSICLAQAQRFQEASEALDQSVQASKDLHSVNMAYVYMHQVIVELQNKNYGKALAAVERLKDFPSEVSDVECHILRGQVLLAMGEHREAGKMFDQAMDKSANVGDTAGRIGIYYLQAGLFLKAEEYLSNMLENFKEDDYNPHLPALAYTYWSMEEFDRCLEILKRCDARYNEGLTELFEESFPGVPPEEYYMYIYKQAYGEFPKD